MNCSEVLLEQDSKCINDFDHGNPCVSCNMYEVRYLELDLNLWLCGQFQLDEAVETEDFQEAARLKVAFDAVTATDSVAEVMNGLKVCAQFEVASSRMMYLITTRQVMLTANNIFVTLASISSL